FMNALSISAMEDAGQGFDVFAITFVDNGRDMREAWGGWADGLTEWNCDGGYIHENTAIDNTDVNLIVGGGVGRVLEGSVIANVAKHAFGGLNVGTFGHEADRSGSVYRHNTIVAEPNQMAFGLMVGDEPWWNPWNPAAFTANAGEIYGNVIHGAVVNLAIDG